MRKSSPLFLFLSFLSYLSYAQNVGIGTTIPTFKLDVKNGSINTDSVYRINSFQVLAMRDLGNLFVGRQAGIVTTGSNNTFSGYTTGTANTTGSFNSFFGSQAGVLNTTGSNNCFFGANAGASITGGNNNIVMGKDALYHNSNAEDNVAIGDAALFNHTGTGANTAVGSKTLYSTVNSINNTAIGRETLYSNTFGNNNTAVGDRAMADNIIYSYNVAVGAQALGNNAGSYNVAIGGVSLQFNNGSGNVGVGFATFTGGSNGTAIGGSASVETSIQNATALGYNSIVTCSNCLALGGNTPTSRTKVGINVSAPLTDLHIIQQSANNFDNTRGIRLQSPNGNYWRTFLDPSNNYVFQYTSGLFSYIEPVTGNFINNSDARLKKDILPLEDVVSSIMQLQAKTYHYKSSEGDRRSYGFIAQEVEKLFPDFVFSSENGMKGIAYSNFSVIAVKAIQEQQQLIEDQKQKIGRLEQQMQEVLKELSEMRSKKN